MKNNFTLCCETAILQKQQPTFGTKICQDICLRTLSVLRSEQFCKSVARGNCELFGTDNVQGQIFEHIFTPSGGYCVYYPSNLFCGVYSFEKWGIFMEIPQFQLGNTLSCHEFRRIACRQKYLMDHKFKYQMELWDIVF